MATGDKSTNVETDQLVSDELRITMTLPGSASLGAFQAGAVSALALVFHELQDRGHNVVIDAIGGASAGSIVGLMFAHAVSTGRDVKALMHDAWVDEIDVSLLRGGDPSAPLSFGELRANLADFLGDLDERPTGVHPVLSSPIVLQISLTSLMGFESEVTTSSVIDKATRVSSMKTLSYTDWMTFDIETESDVSSLLEPAGKSVVDAALVSAAHPVAFSPRCLDRSDERRAYEERGVANFPDDGVLWYTDGGLVESKPVGTVLRRAHRSSEGLRGRRVHFVIDPRSSDPSTGSQWGSEDGEHTWIEGLRRALSIVPTQSLHDDLRGVEAVNDRLTALEDVVEEWCGDGVADDDRQQARAAMMKAADLEGKEHVELHVISPQVVAEAGGESVDELLAGDFVGAFGGFLDRDVRRSDFDLGWRATICWASEALTDFGLEDAEAGDVLDRLAAARPEPAGADNETEGVKSLHWGGRWQLARVAGRAGRIMIGAALPTIELPSPLERFKKGRR